MMMTIPSEQGQMPKDQILETAFGRRIGAMTATSKRNRCNDEVIDGK